MGDKAFNMGGDIKVTWLITGRVTYMLTQKFILCPLHFVIEMIVYVFSKVNVMYITLTGGIVSSSKHV